MAKIKGVLLALGILLLVIPLLVLSVMTHDMNLKSKEKIAGIGKVERIDALDKSIQHGFKVILNKKWGTNVTINQDNRTVTFNENLETPIRDIGKGGSSVDLSNYEKFVEGKYNGSPKINISDYVLKSIYDNLTIFIKPHMAVYKHNGVGREVTFTPEKHEHIAKCGTPCYAGYNVSLKVNELLPTSGSLIEAPKVCGGDNCIKVSISIKNNLGQTLGNDYMTADPEASTTTKINFKSSLDAIEIKIDKSAKLTLKEVVPATNVLMFSIKVDMGNVGYPYEMLSTTLPENLITSYFDEFGTQKTSTATIN